MRIVAGHAGEPNISFAPAFAIFEAVRSEADVVDSNSRESVAHHIFPCAVTCPTKVHRTHWIKPGGIHDHGHSLFLHPRSHRGSVSSPGSVACFAANAEVCGAWIKLILCHRSSCVAAKTPACLGRGQAAACSILKVVGNGEPVFRSYTHALRRSV